MGGSSFTAGEESVTLDFANAEITKNDESIELSDLAEGDILTVEVGSSNTAASATVESVGGGQSFGGSGEVTQGTAATTISEDGTYSGESYTSTGDDENALRVDGTAVTLDGVTVDKSAGAASNTEDGDFYGMNAALLAMNGATVTIKNATVPSSAQNGNGVFSYGGGTTSASNLVVETSGNSSAAIRSDRGGGTVNVSGDADVGTSVFSMTGGSLVGSSGDMFYITNTHCLMTLSGVNIVNNDADGALLRVVGNSASRSWGTAGSNGAQVEFAADGQTLAGDIIVDTISNLTMTMKNGSTFTGTVNIIDNAEGGTAVSDNAVVAIENGCTWNLTGNCTLTSLTNNGTINFNGYIITLTDGTVLK